MVMEIMVKEGLDLKTRRCYRDEFVDDNQIDREACYRCLERGKMSRKACFRPFKRHYAERLDARHKRAMKRAERGEGKYPSGRS